MIRYLLSRLTIFWLILFFKGLAFNVDGQFAQFFKIDLSGSISLMLIQWGLTIFYLILGIVLLNVALTGISFLDHDYEYKERFDNLLDTEKNGSLIGKYLSNIIAISLLNFNHEFDKELFPKQFLAFLLIILPLTFFFIKGNPLLYNYIGVYKEYENIDQTRQGEETSSAEVKSYIYHRTNKGEVSSEVGRLDNARENEDGYYEVNKTYYLFIQAGLIDGFKSYYSEYKGFWAFFGCIPYSLFEKLISAMLYVFLPFVAVISVWRKKSK